MQHGSTVITFVLLLVLGIAALQAMIWIPIIVWYRRKSRAAQARLAAEIELETVLRAPEKGVYRGATAPGYPAVNNNGLIALTRRRVVFLTVTGKSIHIPLTEIRGIQESKAFRRSVVGNRNHLVIQLPGGEIGFFVSDNAAWINAVTNACQHWERPTALHP